MNNYMQVMTNKPQVQLPVSRIKTIMRSDPEVQKVSQEAALLVTKATVSLLVDVMD